MDPNEEKVLDGIIKRSFVHFLSIKEYLQRYNYIQ